MSTQAMIEQIDETLRAMTPDRVEAVWRLVHLLGPAVGTPPSKQDFDVDAFLAWRRAQKNIDVALDESRSKRLKTL